MDVRVYVSEDENRTRTAAKHASLLGNGEGRDLLDVGCASGLFLERATQAGWRGHGLEPNVELAQKAMERLGTGTVLPRTLEDAGLAPHAFDAVTAWDVLEHVADPLVFLTLCAGLVRPSGTLLVKVPDLGSLTARMMRKKWPLLLPEHLNYFTKRSLRALSARAGLQIHEFLRLPVTFSLGYVLYRMVQHGVPGTAIGYRLTQNTAVRRIHLPLYLGELYVVMRPAPKAPNNRRTP